MRLFMFAACAHQTASPEFVYAQSPALRVCCIRSEMRVFLTHPLLSIGHVTVCITRFLKKSLFQEKLQCEQCGSDIIGWNLKGSSGPVTCELHKLSVFHSELLVRITCCPTPPSDFLCVCVCVEAVFPVKGHIKKTKHH